MAATEPLALDLTVLLATKAFDGDDLAHNRRGVLSPKQLAWCAENPRFVPDAKGVTEVETVLGRVAIEGRYETGSMGETTFAKLARGDERLLLHPRLRRGLVRDAPYRAYVARGWVWSIEPITEEELSGATPGDGPYRASSARPGTHEIAKAIEEALSRFLSFTPVDLEANTAGEFSAAQRATARRMLLSASVRALFACGTFAAVVAMLAEGVPFPVFFAIVTLGVLGITAIGSLRRVFDAMARVTSAEPLSAIARLQIDAENSDNFRLESKARPLSIPRAVLAIAEVPPSVLREWRFEVHYVPKTGIIVTIRPLPPSLKKKKKRASANRAVIAGDSSPPR